MQSTHTIYTLQKTLYILSILVQPSAIRVKTVYIFPSEMESTWWVLLDMHLSILTLVGNNLEGMTCKPLDTCFCISLKVLCLGKAFRLYQSKIITPTSRRRKWVSQSRNCSKTNPRSFNNLCATVMGCLSIRIQITLT